MQIVEHNQDQLILRFQRSLWTGLQIGISFTSGGIFFCLFGLLLLKQTEGGSWILPSGMGILLIVTGVFWAIYFPKFTSYTFDKSNNSILIEKQILSNQITKKYIEFPINLIAGVEISTSNGDTTLYYPSLILDRVYWRIHLDSDGDYNTAAHISKTIAQFINVNYFPNESNAPLPVWKQKFLDCAEPYQTSWKYREDEIERLQHHVNQNSFDAEAHQELGILLRSKRNEATFHFKQAENIFEAQQQLDRVILVRVLQELINWN